MMMDTERSEETFELQPERADGPEGSYAAEEDVPAQHRLQRQKFQSRKTFRFRKSRRGNLEVSFPFFGQSPLPYSLTP